MSTITVYPHIAKEGSEPARLVRVPRVRVAQIAMDYLFHGWSADEIVRQHPYLLPAEAHAALLYYFDHQEEISAEIELEIEQAKADRRSAPPSPFVLRMRALGRL